LRLHSCGPVSRRRSLYRHDHDDAHLLSHQGKHLTVSTPLSRELP
jgi:hypothetical protein